MLGRRKLGAAAWNPRPESEGRRTAAIFKRKAQADIESALMTD
jgi:hypothetical protein